MNSREAFIQLDKEFVSLFDKLAYKHGHYSIFDDFLDMALNSFSFNYDQQIMENIRKKYPEKERIIFGQMIFTWLKIQKSQIINDLDTFDYLGYFYEKNAMSKQKGFAQYFTPEHICKLMSLLVLNNNNSNQKSLCEPTCGSGRMNLSAHSMNPKLFHVGNDLDYTCFKMTSLNFMIHGIRGVTTCDDALIPKKNFRGAFIVNDFGTAPYLHFEKDYNTIQNYIALRLGQKLRGKETPTENILQTKFKEIENLKGQLSLF